MKLKQVMLMVTIAVAFQLLASAAVFAAPAPRISSLRVAAVGSTQNQTTYGTFYETIPANLYSTQHDHGDTSLLVITEQYGYDTVSTSKLNGVACRLALSQQIKSGTTVVGFRYTWDCSGQQQGQFVNTATSVGNSQQWSTWINIQ